MKGDKAVGLIPTDGLGYYAMHKKTDGAHFYYSKNPEDIQRVKNNIKEAARKAKDEHQRAKMQLKILQGELIQLLSKYNATIEACQTAGDDQGVEVGVFLSIGQYEIQIN